LRKVLINLSMKALIAFFLILTFPLNTFAETYILVNPQSKTFSIGNESYYHFKDNAGLIQDTLKLGPIVGIDGSGDYTYFTVSKQRWMSTRMPLNFTKAENCLTKEKSTKKFVQLLTSDHKSMLSGGAPANAAEYVIYSAPGAMWTCGVKIDKVNDIKLSTSLSASGREYGWSDFKASESLASIIEYKPSNGVLFNFLRKEGLEVVYYNQTKQQAIKVLSFSGGAAPNSGTLYSTVGTTIGQSLGNITINNTGLPYTGSVSGNVYFKDGKTTIANYENDSGVPIEVKVYKNGSPSVYETSSVSVDLGRYDLGQISNGEYKAVVNFQSDSKFKQWVKKLGGGEYTQITGETKFTVTDKGVTKGTTNITLNVEVKEITSVVDDWFKNGLDQAIKAVVGWLSNSLKKAAEILNNMLGETNNIDDAGLENVWKDLRNVAIGLLTLALLIIALANILQIDLEKYGITRMIPHIVISLVMVYFSFFISRLLLDLASALQKFMESSMGASGLTNLSAAGSNLDTNIGVMSADILIIIVTAIIALVAFVWLLFIIIIRKVVIYFLIAIAPVAFIMNILPFTQSLYSQWWQKFWKWVFMGPAIAFCLFLADKFLTSGFGFSAIKGQSSSWIYMLLTAVCLIIAASVPMTLGGDIISQVTNAIKKHGTKVPGVKSAQGFLKQRSASKDALRNQRVTAFRRKVGQGGVVGRWAAGTSKQSSGTLRDDAITEIQKTKGMELLQNDKLQGIVDSGNEIEATAAARTLASRGFLAVSGKTDEDKKKSAERLNRLMANDQTLTGSVFKDNKTLLHSMSLAGVEHNAKYDDKGNLTDSSALKTLKNTKMEEWKGDMWEYAQKSEVGKTAAKTVLESPEAWENARRSGNAEVLSKMAETASALGIPVGGNGSGGSGPAPAAAPANNRREDKGGEYYSDNYDDF
jgi:hypothetical protein